VDLHRAYSGLRRHGSHSFTCRRKTTLCFPLLRKRFTRWRHHYLWSHTSNCSYSYLIASPMSYKKLMSSCTYNTIH